MTDPREETSAEPGGTLSPSPRTPQSPEESSEEPGMEPPEPWGAWPLPPRPSLRGTHGPFPEGGGSGGRGC